MVSKFKFRPTSSETVSARSKQSGGGYDSYLNSSLSFLKVKEGQNDLRILPPTWDTDGPFCDSWGIELYLHRDIGPDKGAYLCIDEMRKKYGKVAVPAKLGTCPLCAARHEIDDGDAEALKALKPGKQILCYVINRDDEKSGPMVWRLGWQLERDIQIRSQDKKTGATVQITEPNVGYDISFTREGAGLKTKYVGTEIAREDSPLSEKQVRQDKWLEFITENPLTEQLVFFDSDYLEQVYMGKKAKKGGSAEDEEEDDRPTRTKGKARAAVEEDEEDDAPPPRRRAAAVEEDVEEEAPRRRGPRRDQEEDEEEEAPRAKAKSRKPVDEEEEDEPQPRRRKSAEPEEVEDRPKAKRRVVEEDEEEENPPKRNAKDTAGGRTRRVAVEEDEDELPDDKEMARNSKRLKQRPVEEDEEDEPAPRRTSAKRAAVEEEDEDSAEDEDDDVPAPKGKASDRAKASLNRLSSKK